MKVFLKEQPVMLEEIADKVRAIVMPKKVAEEEQEEDEDGLSKASVEV